MGALKDMTSQRFGRLVAIECVGRRNKQALWLCQCDCGTRIETVGYCLRSGDTQSCGCLRNELTGDRARTHGRTRTTEHRIWSLMKDRCMNPNAEHWQDYGGRGIKVCERWQGSFEAFYADMGVRPPSTTLGRVDNDGHYDPGNCAWQTWEEQQNNRRSNCKLTHGGTTRTLSQWASVTGIRLGTLWARVNAGWDAETVLTRPVRQDRRHKDTSTRAERRL